MKKTTLYFNMVASTIITLIMTVNSGCVTSEKAASNSNDDILRVGVSLSPPFVMCDGDQFQGIDIDLAHAIAADLNKKVDFILMQWDELALALQNKQVDCVISGVSITDKRKQMVDFSIPYIDVNLVAVMRCEDYEKTYSDPEDIIAAHVKIGALPQTTGSLFIEQQCSDATLISVERNDDVPEMLKNGTIDMYINDDPICKWIISTSPHQFCYRLAKINSDSLAVAVDKGNAESLLYHINQVIARLIESGQIQDMVDHWVDI